MRLTRLPSALLVLCGLALLVAEPVAPPADALRPASAGVGYQSPVAGTLQVTRAFRPPARRWLPGHRGVDLAAPDGALIVTAGPGVVRFAGLVAGRPVVSVDHPDGLRTTYEPVRPLVNAGDQLAAGDPIGILEATHAGCPVTACLHWGLRHGAHYLDPLSLLGVGRVRLLPD